VVCEGIKKYIGHVLEKGMAWHGIAWYSMAWKGMAAHDMWEYDSAWGTARHVRDSIEL